MLIPENIVSKLKERFYRDLVKNVTLTVFTQEYECQFCKECRELAEDLSTISDKIKVEVYDFQREPDKAVHYGVSRIPAIVVSGEKDYGIRFYGIPSGYEFSAFIETLVNVSRGESGLSEATKMKVKEIKKPIHIQVFVTPTCPYCPRAVRLAHQMAIESEYVKADMVETVEFPQLAQKYGVMAVPKTVVNDEFGFDGGLPEEQFVEHVILGLRETHV